MFAGAVVILNLLDAIFTLTYTSSGLATEANPVMAVALAASPVTFMIAKLALVSVCVLVLWRMRHRRTAVAGLVGATVTYTTLLLYHLSAVPYLVAAHS